MANYKEVLLILVVLLIICSCGSDTKNVDVGDIVFDEKTDDPNFQFCNEQLVKQYYVRYSSDTPATYRGEKIAIDRTFDKAYQYPVTPEADGYVTIRFVVNCNGQSGRFRMEEMDLNYQPKNFDKKITDQLLDITKSLDGWIPVKRKDKKYDFYQYLTFKLKSGQIEQILP